MSNIPVEEVWTMPNKHEVHGFVTITKPLILRGTTIHEDIMIGDSTMNVYGLRGQEEVLLMKNGMWAIL